MQRSVLGAAPDQHLKIGKQKTNSRPGDPVYKGEFVIASYVPAIATGGAITFTATLNPATGTAPFWTTKV